VVVAAVKAEAKAAVKAEAVEMAAGPAKKGVFPLVKAEIMPLQEAND